MQKSTWFLVNLALTRCGDFLDRRISWSLSCDVLEPRKNPMPDFLFQGWLSATVLILLVIISHLPSPIKIIPRQCIDLIYCGLMMDITCSFNSLFIFRLFLTCRVVFYSWPSSPKRPCRVENIVIMLCFAKRKHGKGWFEMMPGRKWFIIMWSISKAELLCKNFFIGVPDWNRIILLVNMWPIICINNDFIILKFGRKLQKKVFNALTPGWKWTIFWSI